MHLLQHENCVDTAIEVVKKYYVKEKDLWKLKVTWWRVSRVRLPGRSHGYPPRCMYITQAIQIQGKDLPKWKHIHTFTV